MFKDVDGNKLYLGTRVAAVWSIPKAHILLGVVVGHTEKRVKVDFGGNQLTKNPKLLVKVFNQKKDNND